MDHDAISAGLKKVFEDDRYAQKLGIELMEAAPGYARARMLCDDTLLNFNGFIHGGAIFSLLDYAFSVACNAHNESAVAIAMSIQFISAAPPGGRIVAEAREVDKSRKLGLYEMTVRDEAGKLICKCDGRVYRIGKPIVGPAQGQ
ncbi:MAG TPA: hotdog fold thioesterase [bacterium]|nr:hotdog fold thioesterase [bacterium]